MGNGEYATEYFFRTFRDFGKHARKGIWWTGLDSNQRTENRADLQSAAFNHSATCPLSCGALRGGKGPVPEERAAYWRNAACLSMAEME
jgi:hypothetical protein